MLRPSKLFQRTMLASAKACVSTPGAAPARVQAVAARPAASSVSTVLGPLAPSIATAISPLAGCRPIARTLPPGSAGAGRSLSVRASNRRSSSRPSTLMRAASSLPSLATASWSTSQGMCADSGCSVLRRSS